MGKLFGTDGVRGIANSELTPELAFRLGKAGAYVLSRQAEHPTILIGKDTRISGDMLEDALSAGILATGGNVVKVGVLPTPAVAYLVRRFKAAAGVMISASHNPFEYNGIKFFSGDGYKLDDALEEQIEAIVLGDTDVSGGVTGASLGRCLKADEEALEKYVEFLCGTIDCDIRGMKIVIDCANGAAYRAAAMVYRALGAEPVLLSDQPNGVNINDGCGSTHPENLQKAVIEHGAEIGLAYDGDADRLIAVDEKGRVIDGDRAICICARMLKETGQLAGNRVTATVMSNIGFHRYIEKLGCTVDVTGVGDRYVLESMRKTGCVIGGEQSGHIIFLNHTTTGDGILSSLQLIQAVRLSGKTVGELADEIRIYPQVLRNAAVRNENKKTFASDPEIAEAIQRVERKMDGEGRVLIRPSGTEPLVRVMIEGNDIAEITALADEMAALVTARLG